MTTLTTDVRATAWKSPADDRLMVVTGLVLVTAVAAALRLFHLGYKPLWSDEAILWWIANRDLSGVIAQNVLSNSAPPLFALLLHGIVRFSSSEAALRALSCAAGIASIPALYLLARRFASSGVALFAAGLVAVAPEQVRYSQTAREYSLAFLLATLLVLAFDRFAERPSWQRAITATAAMLLSVATQYGLALLVLALNIVFVLQLRRQDRRISRLLLWTAVNLVTLAGVWLDWRLALRDQIATRTLAGMDASIAYLARGYWNGSLTSIPGFVARNTWDILRYLLPGDLTALTVAVGLVFVFRESTRRMAAWLLLATFAVAALAGILRLYPYMGYRQLMFLAPMVYVFAALGIGHAWRTTRDHSLAVILALFMVAGSAGYAVSYLRSPGNENIRPVVQALTASLQPGDRTWVYWGAEIPFRYYTRGTGMRWIVGAYSPDPSNTDPYRKQIEQLVADPGRLWLVFSHGQPEEMKAILGYFRLHRQVSEVGAENDAWLYLVNPASVAAAHPSGSGF
jgi:uncharacterized membrane protein